MDINNILLSNNISYKIISPYQKVENDKERIKSKFNFNISRTSTNSSIFKQSSLPTQKNSLIPYNNKKNNIKNKILQQNDKKLNICQYRPKSTINIKINKKDNNNNSMTNQKINNNSLLINQSKASGLSYKNKDKKFNLTYEDSNIDIKDTNNKKKKKNNIPYNKQNYNNIMTNQSLIKNNKILNNITYNNYNTFLNDNSLAVIDNQKYFLQDSILNTQTLFEGINNYNEKNNNKKKNNNQHKIQNGNDEIGIENEVSESLNKSSFSGSSKTSELHGDILNIKNNTNSANEGNIQIVNNENYVIKNFNGLNMNKNKNNNNKNNINNNFNNNNNIDLKKKNDDDEEIMGQIIKPFNDNSERRRTEVNTMGLLDDDEYNQENRKKMLNNISKYYFIEDIIKKNNNFVSLSFNKFKSISNKAKYKIFSFVYDNYKNFFNSSIYMRNIIKDMLEEQFSYCIKDFENKYKNILLIDNYQFNIHSFVKPKLKKKKFHTFCLFIKAKVLPNNKYLKKFGDVTFQISYKYKISSIKNEYNMKSNRTNISSQSYISKDHIQEEYMQIFQFDLRKNKNYPMWICSERDEIFNYASRNIGGGINNLISRFLVTDELFQKHLIYSSPIINVNENDYIVFRIDLIENNNIIENISFNDFIVQLVNKNYYHKITFKQEQKFDKMRDCESELAINVWHDDYVINEYNKKNINYEEFLCRLRKCFQEYFEIIEIKFDISKFVFIRMTMKAKKIGILKNNIFSNKDIKIIDKNTSVTKECTTINFVNTFSMYKYLTIKQGTIIDFYLME